MWPALKLEKLRFARNESVGTRSAGGLNHHRGSGSALDCKGTLFMSLNPSRKDLPVHPDGRHVVGIDIGRQTHAAAGLTAAGRDFGRQILFANTRAGISKLETQLLKRLDGPKSVLVGMEATGHYWMPLYFEMQRRGYECVVINPIQTRAKFRTRIRKTKTDKLDARAIARLLLSGEAHAARIPDEATLGLRLQVRHRWRLMDLLGDLHRFAYSLVDRLFPEFRDVFCSPLNVTGRALLHQIGLTPQAVAEDEQRTFDIVFDASRNKVPSTKVAELLLKARDSIGIRRAENVLVAQLRATVALITEIEGQLDALDGELHAWVEKRKSPLVSLGIKSPLIATLHAESDPISDFRHPWQYAAYAGLDPSRYDSGQMQGTRTPISKRGSPYLRRALYLTASAIYRRHRVLARLYQKARREKHHHTDALIIVAHKLARIVWRLLTDNRPFLAQAPSRPTETKS
jgi:transposase